MATTDLALSEEVQRALDRIITVSGSSNIDRLMHLALSSTALCVDDPEIWMELLKTPNDFFDKFRDIAENCYQIGQWQRFRVAAYEYLHLRKTTPRLNLRQNYDPDDEATRKSWEGPFVGNAASVLKETIMKHTQCPSPNLYSLSMSIVQSSGTGKSRLIDELARTIPVVFLNTRPENHSGFPAADKNVRDFFNIKEDTSDAADKKYYCFLSALFDVLREYFKTQLDQKVGITGRHRSLPDKLRYLMTSQQTYSSQGPLRMKFYSEVLEKAKQFVENPALVDDNLLFDNAKALEQWLPDGTPLVLAIDEVHGLVHGGSHDHGFAHLRRQLNKIVSVTHIFTVLLSTTGKIQSYTPPASTDPSARRRSGRIRLLPPFTSLGFDQLAQEAVEVNKLLIDDIISDEFMANFGRPLFGSRYKHGSPQVKDDILNFASQKLLGGGSIEPCNLSSSATLACLATRLALQFNTISLDDQLKQIEQHMRMCLIVKEDVQTAITIAASEPILSEASASITSRRPGGKTLPCMLRDTLVGTPSLSLGDRGELAGLLLLTMARDTLVYPENGPRGPKNRSIPLCLFFKKLLGVKNLNATLPVNVAFGDKPTAFGETFKNSRIHFNHFVKVTDFDVINRHFLWKIASRGAGILCADRQQGIDAILVAVRDHTKPLGPDNIVITLVQIKNDINFQAHFKGHLFDMQNPYLLRIFEEESGPHNIPLIRLVFALASSEAEAYALQGTHKSPRTTKERKTTFTSFDFWCAGTTAKTFPVIGSEEKVYREILQRDVYNYYMALRNEPNEAELLKRSSNPATCKHQAHWSYIKEEKAKAADRDDEQSDDSVMMDLDAGGGGSGFEEPQSNVPPPPKKKAAPKKAPANAPAKAPAKRATAKSRGTKAAVIGSQPAKKVTAKQKAAAAAPAARRSSRTAATQARGNMVVDDG